MSASCNLPQLQKLPFDILYEISKYLQVHDVIHLSQSSPHLEGLTEVEVLCRQIVEKNHSYSLEAGLARSGHCTYQDAIWRIYYRLDAIAKGEPSLACVVGSASSFIYNQGIVCFLSRETITLVDVHRTGFRWTFPCSRVWHNFLPSTNPHSELALLHYSDGILCLLCKEAETGSDWLLAARFDETSGQLTLRASKQLDSTVKLFVRNTADYVYFGTHSAVGSQNYHEWVIQGLSLDESRPFSRQARTTDPDGSPLQTRKIQLNGFPGSRIGLTVDFAIHDEHLYCVTNLNCFGLIEVDWTSVYQTICIPLADPTPSAILASPRRFYRRQHAEGPIDDGWTDISLQADEATCKLLVVEARREFWLGAPAAERTFYVKHVPDARPDAPATDDDVPLPGDEDGPVGPPGDDLRQLSNRLATWVPDRHRLAWQVHPENRHAGCLKQGFILKETKFRTYNHAAGTFMDLILDEACCEGPGGCLRLRSGARKESGYGGLPANEQQFSKMMKMNTASLEADGTSRLDEDRESASSSYPESSFGIYFPTSTSEFTTAGPSPYNFKPINLWPPKAKESSRAARAHKIMNHEPDLETDVSIDAIADERSILYLIRKPGEEMGKIVCLCFDIMAGAEQLDGLCSRGNGGNLEKEQSGDTRRGGVGKGDCPSQFPYFNGGSNLQDGSNRSTTMASWLDDDDQWTRRASGSNLNSPTDLPHVPVSSKRKRAEFDHGAAACVSGGTSRGEAPVPKKVAIGNAHDSGNHGNCDDPRLQANVPAAAGDLFDWSMELGVVGLGAEPDWDDPGWGE